MYITVSKSMFHDMFRDYGRLDNFSYEAREAFYDYLTEIEEDCGEEMELDIIGLCCDYSEEPIQEVLDNYNLESLDELKDNTTVVWHNDTHVLYQCY